MTSGPGEVGHAIRAGGGEHVLNCNSQLYQYSHTLVTITMDSSSLEIPGSALINFASS